MPTLSFLHYTCGHASPTRGAGAQVPRPCPECARCALLQPTHGAPTPEPAGALLHVVLFDSDSNPIAAYPAQNVGAAVQIGLAIVEHFRLVDDTTRENAALGIEAATDHIIVMRAMLGPDDPFYGGGTR